MNTRNSWLRPSHFHAIALLIATAALASGCNRGGEGRGRETPETVEPQQAQPNPDAPQYDTADRLSLSGSPWRGAMNAPVTIVEFSDYQCPFCSRAEPTIQRVLEEFPNDVRVVFKQLPLDFHEHAHLAAEAALAAHAQGKFWEMHDLLFANQQALTRPDLERYAEQIGLNMEQFRAALDNGAFRAAVDADVAVATGLSIRGTPNFLINGRALRGAQPFEQFAEAIRAEVEVVRPLVEGGRTLGDVFGERLTANLAANANSDPQQQPRRNSRPQPDPNAELLVPVENSPSRGPADALVTIVEFSDFQCPYCSRVEATVNSLLEEFPNDVRVVWKQLPLPFHDNADPAARASIAAHNQNKFWEMHDLLFANQQALTRPDLERYAEQLGLNMEQFRADMDAETTGSIISRDGTLARRLAAQGTPHFFINGYRLRGAQPVERFREVINREIEKARELIAGGTPRSGVYDALQADAIQGDAPMLAPPPDAPQPDAPQRPSTPVNIDLGSAPRRGPAGAPVTVVLYTDYQCPFCSRFENNLAQAIDGELAQSVQVVVKQYPLPMHNNAQLAAEAALAANAQGKFWEMHELMFQNQRALSREDIERYAEQIGLNMQQFRSALDNGEFRAQVEAEFAEGGRHGVTGTPAWFVNGSMNAGAMPPDQIATIIRQAMNPTPAPQ